jgi:putative Mn2+ efflux pump MntP
MDLLTQILIGIGLSMDCLAVSLSIGGTTTKDHLTVALVYGLCFGVFQTGMTLLGWAAGTPLAVYIVTFGPWLSFFLLVLIGGKMIIEGFREEASTRSIGTFQILPVVLVSIATSIDAFAAGISFAFLRQEILTPALIIGLIAFIISCAGVLSGNRLRSCLGKSFEILGGFILVAVGLTILLQLPV